MSVRFLILNTDYPESLRWLYAQLPGLENKPHEEQVPRGLDLALEQALTASLDAMGSARKNTSPRRHGLWSQRKPL